MELPKANIETIVNKENLPFYFSYTIINIEDSKHYQHNLQFGIEPFGISIDATTSPNITLSIHIWRFNFIFGGGYCNDKR
tara:strand:- start:7329 stop:7568 length:240 start_codon:yes stop_codon:yes gene_type:complete